MKYKLTVSAASGVESVTKRELFKLGYGDCPAINGRIQLYGDEADILRLNVNLRTAERVMIVVKECTAETFDELFDAVISVQWKDYIARDGKIMVSGKSVKSKLFAISACQGIVKKAIAENLMKAYGDNFLSESGNAYGVEFALFEDKLTISINTSGEGLHKRGYRDLSVRAPLKETLAAATVMLSNWSFDKPLVDLFCGSGTIPIEAALYALNIAPNKERSFDCQKWGIISQQLSDRVYQEALDNEIKGKKFEICGYDIDDSVIGISLRHSRRAGVLDTLHFAKADMKCFYSTISGGTLISNLPYGERLLSEDEVRKLYGEFGDVYRRLDRWSLYAFTSCKTFEYDFGQYADKRRKLYNADLECCLYQYGKDQRNIRIK
ncbi:MAG: class I SAM-dependent RNA methyltransferase [Clostridia bacterium]